VNRPCAVAMRPVVELLCPLVIIRFKCVVCCIWEVCDEFARNFRTVV